MFALLNTTLSERIKDLHAENISNDHVSLSMEQVLEIIKIARSCIIQPGVKDISYGFFDLYEALYDYLDGTLPQAPHPNTYLVTNNRAVDPIQANAKMEALRQRHKALYKRCIETGVYTEEVRDNSIFSLLLIKSIIDIEYLLAFLNATVILLKAAPIPERVMGPEPVYSGNGIGA